MMKKKVCLLGANAVGKSSLVRRYVYSVFSDKYHSTIGVKIDKKTIQYNDQELQLLLWDIQGEDSAQTVLPGYLRGMSGYLLVVDRTRTLTYKYAHALFTRVEQSGGGIPFLLVQNKTDLKAQWQPEDAMLAELSANACAVVNTSALNGEAVELCFTQLAETMLA